MKLDRRTKYLGIAAIGAVTLGIGLGAVVPTKPNAAVAAGPDVGNLLNARSPGMRTNAALSVKERPAQQMTNLLTRTPVKGGTGRTPSLKVASVTPVPPVVALSNPIAPAALAAIPAPAVMSYAPALPITAAAPVAAGGALPLLSVAAALPIIPALLGGGGGGGTTISVAPAVPEPAMWLMMITGFGMLGFALRHHRERKQRLVVRANESTAPHGAAASLARSD